MCDNSAWVIIGLVAGWVFAPVIFIAGAIAWYQSSLLLKRFNAWRKSIA